jgi:aryl-alcohol dehydrogenase-like predicted oxidoreductase
MASSTQRRSPAIETEFVEVPATRLKVSRVALGTWAMGGWMWGGTDQRESIATIRAALRQGINLIDTAPAYGFGVSEEIVGEALEGVRTQAVIATKTGLEWRDGKVYRNATRERITQEVDDSLRRLRTDYIDIYQVHWPDPKVPVEETAEAMRSLYEAGKIRAIGVSNFSVAEMERFRHVAPLHVLQPPYNRDGHSALCSRQSHCDSRLWSPVSGVAQRAHAPRQHVRRRRSAAHRPEISAAAFCAVSGRRAAAR